MWSGWIDLIEGSNKILVFNVPSLFFGELSFARTLDSIASGKAPGIEREKEKITCCKSARKLDKSAGLRAVAKAFNVTGSCSFFPKPRTRACHIECDRHIWNPNHSHFL